MKLFQAYLHLLLFLSLTTTSIAIPRYAKQGCIDRCGSVTVTIPYPFGIGERCSVNPWYTIDCKNSATPTVTVNTPTVSYCQKPVWNSRGIMGVDLDGSPFLFSKLNNKFVFEGCGNAKMVMDNGSVLTGCSTTCSGTPSKTNKCFGINCCQTTIPDRFMSYSINLTGFETQGENGGCRSAALVDKTSYDEGRVSVRDALQSRYHLCGL
ncbi:putative wall-associated receptor kinase, galacturonan-binding domain-containing protein [Helianthus annuus]|nr:putative wall-associated receptor kinase, galacturonan-binding domain-containing protein [Helianthus annuus]